MEVVFFICSIQYLYSFSDIQCVFCAENNYESQNGKGNVIPEIFTTVNNVVNFKDVEFFFILISRNKYILQIRKLNRFFLTTGIYFF